MILRRRTMSQVIIPERWLFVCSMNWQRSPTAEYVARKAGYWADSCGTSEAAGKRLAWDRVNWADVIVCMEEEHRIEVQRITGTSVRVFNWDVRDDYRYMDPKLVTLLEGRFEETKKILDRMDEEEARKLDAAPASDARPLHRLSED
jgi:predicted protein tyrosine phosphatase